MENLRTSRMAPGRSWLLLLVAAVLLLAVAADSHAQRAGRGRGGGQTAQQAAPINMTGTWVSIVTEDWRFRMLTPPRGDYESIPINAEARRIADMWDPARDEAMGEECRWYGAASIMSVPGRLRITWEDPETLRMDTDAGMQTRRFHFAGPPAAAAPSWQGSSTAE